MAAFFPEDFDAPDTAPSSSFMSLSSPDLFGTLPDSDSLTALLKRQGIPYQSYSAQWQTRSVEEMRQTGSWRDLARYAEASIRGSTLDDPTETLELWSLRSEALQRLGLFDLLAQELSSLFAILPPAISLSQTPHVSTLIPFELVITHASLHGLLGRPGPSLNALFELLQACKLEYRLSQDVTRQLWQGRIRYVGLKVLTFLMDEKAYEAAVAFAQQLVATFPGDAQLQRSLQSAHIAIGDIASARATLSTMSHEQQKQLPGILQAMAENDWDKALELAKQLSEETSDLKNVNNFAAISLIQGNLDEAYAKMSLLPTQDRRGFFASPPMISNLTAMLELLQSPHVSQQQTTETPQNPQWTKQRLLQEAVEYLADGTRADVFKL